MGNAAARMLTAPSAAAQPADVLSDLPGGVLVKSSLGGGRFLKTVRRGRARTFCRLHAQLRQASEANASLLVLPSPRLTPTSCCAPTTPAAAPCS